MAMQHLLRLIRLPLIVFLLGNSLSGQLNRPDIHGPLRDQDHQISQYIRRIFQDSKGNLWFGTNDDGVARYDGKTLTYFSRDGGFCGSAVRAMLEDAKGRLWFATSGGVCMYDGKSFESITQDDGLRSNQTWCLLIDKNGILWIGTEGGVSTYDGKHVIAFVLPFRPTLNSSSYPPTTLVNWMLQDRKGNIWFCTNGRGAFRYDGKEFRNFSEAEGLGNNYVQTIYEDRAGGLWFGLRGGGLSRYDDRTNTFTTFTTAGGLCGNFVWTLLEDTAGILWIATAGGGLCSTGQVSTPSGTQTFRAYGEKQGLRSRHVQSLLADNRGRLWIGTSGGAFRLQDGRFVNITKAGPWE